MALPAVNPAWQLDTVAMNDGLHADTGFSYLVKTSKGWRGTPAKRPDSAPRPNAGGLYRGPNYDGGRVVELEGIAQCESPYDRDSLCDSLEGMFRGPFALADLIRHERSRSLKLRVELNAATVVTELPDGLTVTWNAQLLAIDGRKFDTTLQSATTLLAQAPADGVLWNGTPGNTGTEWNGPASPATGLVYQSSAGTPGLLSVANHGTAPAPVIFTITCGSSNTLIQPTLIDSVTGSVIKYAGTMVPADVLTVDTGTGLVALNGAAGAGQLARADLFEVAPGVTTSVQFTAAGPSAGSTARADWHDAY